MSDSGMTSVPVQVDASQLGEVLQKMAQQQNVQTETIEPAPFIADAGERMKALYARYLDLAAIGNRLHGKKLSDPIPEDLFIGKITISYGFPKEDAKGSELKTVDIYNVACIGDLSPLLSTELGSIVYALEEEVKAVADIAKKTQDTCTKAREEWEASNPERKIIRADTLDANGRPISSQSQVAVNADPAGANADNET
jgi:hypothetical protein